MFTKFIIPCVLVFAFGCTKSPNYDQFKFKTTSYDMVQGKADSRHPASGGLVPLLQKALPMIAEQTNMSVGSVEKTLIAVGKAKGVIEAASKVKSISELSSGQRTFFTQALYSGQLANMHKAFSKIDGQSIILNAMEGVDNPVLQAQYPVPTKGATEKLVSSGAGYATDRMLTSLESSDLVKNIKDSNITMKQAGSSHPIVETLRVPFVQANAFWAQNTGTSMLGNFCKSRGGKYDITISDNLVPVYLDVVNQANHELVTFMKQTGLSKVTDPDHLALLVFKAQKKVTGQPCKTAAMNVGFLSAGGTEAEVCDLYSKAIGEPARKIANSPEALEAVCGAL